MRVFEASCSLGDVFSSLSSLERCIFVQSDGKLIGSVSQGDLLRYFNSSKNLDMSVKISDIMNLNPVYVYEYEVKNLIHLFIKHSVSDIAILNGDQKIINIISVFDILRKE